MKWIIKSLRFFAKAKASVKEAISCFGSALSVEADGGLNGFDAVFAFEFGIGSAGDVEIFHASLTQGLGF